MSSTVALHRPRQSATPPHRDQTRAARHDGKDAPLVGAWVQVERGVAAHTCGFVHDCRDGRATLLATVLAGRPVVLTVDASDCAPIDRMSP